MKRGVDSIGEYVTRFLDWLGTLTRMLGHTLAVGPKRPFGLFDISYQTLQLGIRSLPMGTLMSVFIGMIMAWHFGEALADFGAVNTIGYVSALALVRELVPTMLALTVGVKMATGMTAELGSMKVTEQIDAIASLGADPYKKLVWPRVVAATIALPLLVAWGDLMSLGGGMFVSESVFDVPAAYFYTTYIDELHPIDYMQGMVKALVFGMVAGLIGCHQGFSTKFGTEAVGISTTETVVAVSIAVLIADFILTTMFVPI